MHNNQRSSVLFNTNQFLLFLLLLFAIMYWGRTFLVPIVLGSLLAMLLVPLTSRLEKWRFPRIIAALVSVLLTVSVIIAVFSVLINQLVLLGQDFGSMDDKFPAILEKIYVYISDTFELSKEQQENYVKSQLSLASGQITNLATLVLRSLGIYLVNFMIVITYTVLLLLYRDRLKSFVIQLVRNQSKESVMGASHIVEKTTKVASSYIAGIFIVVLILSIVNTIVLSIIGVKHALFFGLTAGLLNLIPYVGSVLGSVIPVFYALMTSDTTTAAFMTGLYFIIIQHVESYILTPNIAGAKVDLSPLATISALLLGGFIWGIAGMVVFVPILGIVKVVFDNVQELRPYGFVISSR